MTEYPSHFKLCTFNLYNYVEPPFAYYEHENIYSTVQWQKKEAWIRQRLLDLVPDIIGFQEVFSPDALKKLTQSLGFKYFTTVSEPLLDAHHVYNKPVVALASRYPILSASAVEGNADSAEQLGLQAGFRFSRPPIRAEVHVKGLGTLLVYVVHFKSKRAEWPQALAANEVGLPDGVNLIANSLLAKQMGSWLSSIQRGTEAALLYQDIVEQMQCQERPVVLMGDFNDSIESTPLQPLIASQYQDRLNGRSIADMSIEDRRSVQRFCLYDGFEIQEPPMPAERQPSHYFANKGNVLDYILLSKDFKLDHDHSLAHVSAYTVDDRHLIDAHPEQDAECSDHALVMLELEIRF